MEKMLLIGLTGGRKESKEDQGSVLHNVLPEYYDMYFSAGDLCRAVKAIHFDHNSSLNRKLQDLHNQLLLDFINYTLDPHVKALASLRPMIFQTHWVWIFRDTDKSRLLRMILSSIDDLVVRGTLKIKFVVDTNFINCGVKDARPFTGQDELKGTQSYLIRDASLASHMKYCTNWLYDLGFLIRLLKRRCLVKNSQYSTVTFMIDNEARDFQLNLEGKEDDCTTYEIKVLKDLIREGYNSPLLSDTEDLA